MKDRMRRNDINNRAHGLHTSVSKTSWRRLAVTRNFHRIFIFLRSYRKKKCPRAKENKLCTTNWLTFSSFYARLYSLCVCLQLFTYCHFCILTGTYAVAFLLVFKTPTVQTNCNFSINEISHIFYLYAITIICIFSD